MGMSSTLSEEERKVIAEIREKHGDAIKAKRLKTGELVVVRKPGFEYQRATNRLGKRDAEVYDIQLHLVQQCTVYPGRDELGRLLDEYKGLVILLADAIDDLSKGDADDVDLGEG
jgi:hypothetical protein